MTQSMSDTEWRIHEPKQWKVPPALHPRMEQLVREFCEKGILHVPMHSGILQPVKEACPRSEHHIEDTTRFVCLCHGPSWRRAHTIDLP